MSSLYKHPPPAEIPHPVSWPRVVFHEETTLCFPNGYTMPLEKDVTYVGVFSKDYPEDKSDHHLGFKGSGGYYSFIAFYDRLNPMVPYSFYDTKVTVEYIHLFDVDE